MCKIWIRTSALKSGQKQYIEHVYKEENKLNTENFSRCKDYNLIAAVMTRSWIRRVLTCLKWCSVYENASNFDFRGEEMDLRREGIVLLSVRLKPWLFKPESNVTGYALLPFDEPFSR